MFFPQVHPKLESGEKKPTISKPWSSAHLEFRATPIRSGELVSAKKKPPSYISHASLQAPQIGQSHCPTRSTTLPVTSQGSTTLPWTNVSLLKTFLFPVWWESCDASLGVLCYKKRLDSWWKDTKILWGRIFTPDRWVNWSPQFFGVAKTGQSQPKHHKTSNLEEWSKIETGLRRNSLPKHRGKNMEPNTGFVDHVAVFQCFCWRECVSGIHVSSTVN